MPAMLTAPFDVVRPRTPWQRSATMRPLLVTAVIWPTMSASVASPFDVTSLTRPWSAAADTAPLLVVTPASSIGGVVTSNVTPVKRRTSSACSLPRYAMRIRPPLDDHGGSPLIRFALRRRPRADGRCHADIRLVSDSPDRHRAVRALHGNDRNTRHGERRRLRSRPFEATANKVLGITCCQAKKCNSSDNHR